MIKVIIFDFGGVITVEGSFQTAKNIFHQQYNLSEEKLESVFRENWKFARIGSLTLTEFWQNIANQLHVDKDAVIHIFTEILERTNPEMIQLIDELHRRQYTLVLLSNHIREVLEDLLDKKNLRRYFALVVTSYNEKIAKPDSRLLTMIKEKCNVEFDECVVIDDQEKNTIAGNTVGMKSILYKNMRVEELRDKFRNLGVVV